MKTIFISFLVAIYSIGALAIPVEGHKILISAANPLAVEAGRKVAEKGGNVIDVAIEVGLVMSVTSPFFAALGGGGFALVKMDGPVEALDFREMAPAATGPDYYLKLPKSASIVGGHAVGVPGIPAGYVALHKKFGRLKWAELFEEPIRLAEKGFPVSGEWVRKTADEIENFNPGAKRRFLKKDGSMYKPGEILRQPELAKALREYQRLGEKGFYQGPVAKDIVESVAGAGGAMTLADLKNYKVRWLKPLTTKYKGYELFLMPPPSSGGVVILSALKMLEKLRVDEVAELSTDEFHLMAEIQSRAFRGRSLLGDPDFAANAVPRLTSDTYLDEMAKSISRTRAKALEPLKDAPPQEKSQTTHYSVMDKDGRAVAITITLNGDYGSGVATDVFGIALNNEMDDFTTRPNEPNMFGLIQGTANKVEPGKRPLSSMSPTLVLKNDKVVMAIGAPGGPRIISSVLQALYRILGRNGDIDIAVQAPRVHHQFLPPKVFIDAHRFSPEVLKGLRDRGHTLEEGWMGRVYVVRRRADGILEGAFDSRGEGAVGGL